jgi:hypothetical protein
MLENSTWTNHRGFGRASCVSILHQPCVGCRLQSEIDYHGRMSEPQQEPAAGDEAVDAAGVDQSSPPKGSQITIERFPDGLTIQIPAAGLWRGTHGLFAFALIWNGFMTVFTVAMLGTFFGAGAMKDQAIWILPAVLSLFWLVGIGILLGSLNMGRRRAAIAVTGGTLMVIQTGLFGSKQRDWPQGEVEAVRAGPSGMTVNDQPVLELQIFDGGASKLGLLAGRSDRELEWLAATLREALGVAEYQS